MNRNLSYSFTTLILCMATVLLLSSLALLYQTTLVYATTFLEKTIENAQKDIQSSINKDVQQTITKTINKIAANNSNNNINNNTNNNNNTASTATIANAPIGHGQNTTSSATSIPAIAKGPAIPSKGYLVQEIRGGLYWVTDGVYNTMFLVSNNGVIAVDAPPSLGEKYIQAIREVTNQPIKFVVYSHSHADHIGAAGTIYPKNVTFVAQEETGNLLKLANDSHRPIPNITFKDHYQLVLGNQTLELDYKGLNHEPGNIFIYAPQQKVLMLVDVIFPGWVPFKDLAISASVPGFIQAHDIVLSYDFNTLVGGHLTRLGTVEDVKLQKEFINDLINASKSANSKFNFMDFVKEYGLSNPWLTYSKYADAITNDCTNTMLAGWKDRLGGAEDFMQSHCWKMTESQRVD